MKIMQVIPYFCFGGAETMCENLTYALTELGHEVVVVSLISDRTPIARRMEEAGIRIRYLDKKLGLDLSMFPKLISVMKQERPDVVHTHLNVIKYAAMAAKLAGVPACVHTVHSVADKEAEGRLQKISNGFYFRHDWSVPIALSGEIQETISDFYRMDKERIPVIRNGVDLSKCMVKEDYSLHAPIRLIHVGRFDVPKNHAGLLRSFAKLRETYPDSCLHLLGDGDLRPDMEKLALELGIADSVQFYGMQANVYPHLREADLFLLPSIYEGNPMSIIEAMGTGLPIAATTVGGIPDMLRNKETALLVPCDEEAFCDACMELLGDENLRHTLGKQALADSVRFSAEFMAQQYCDVYRK